MSATPMAQYEDSMNRFTPRPPLDVYTSSVAPTTTTAGGYASGYDSPNYAISVPGMQYGQNPTIHYTDGMQQYSDMSMQKLGAIQMPQYTTVQTHLEPQYQFETQFHEYRHVQLEPVTLHKMEVQHLPVQQLELQQMMPVQQIQQIVQQVVPVQQLEAVPVQPVQTIQVVRQVPIYYRQEVEAPQLLRRPEPERRPVERARPERPVPERERAAPERERAEPPPPPPEPVTIEVTKEVYVDRIVKIPTEVPIERIVEIPTEKLVYRDVAVPVEKTAVNEVQVPVDRVVERDVIREIQVEKTVKSEVPVYVDKVVVQEIPVPVERFVDRMVQIPVQQTVAKEIPVMVEKVIVKEVPVPVEKVVYIDKYVEVPIEKVIERTVFKEVPIERVVFKEVPVEVDKIVEKTITREVEIPIEIQVPTPVEKIVEKKVIQEIPVIKEVPVEVMKVVENVRVKEVPVDRVVYSEGPCSRGNELEIDKLKIELARLQAQYSRMQQERTDTRITEREERSMERSAPMRRGSTSSSQMQISSFSSQVQTAPLSSQMHSASMQSSQVQTGSLSSHVQRQSVLRPVRNVGLGLHLIRNDQSTKTWVEEIIPGFAAHKNGELAVGDIIVAIDGEEVEPYDLEGIKQRTVGPEGTLCTLQVLRGNKHFAVTLERMLPDLSSESPSPGSLGSGRRVIVSSSSQGYGDASRSLPVLQGSTQYYISSPSSSPPRGATYTSATTTAPSLSTGYRTSPSPPPMRPGPMAERRNFA